MPADNIVINKIKLKRKTIIIVALIFAIAAIAVYGYYSWNRTAALASNQKPDLIVSAIVLSEEFISNEAEANKKYLGKILEVNGSIVSLNNLGDSVLTVNLGSQEALSSVSCELDNRLNPMLGNYKVGDSLTIVGTCTGYLADVEISNAAIISPKK